MEHSPEELVALVGLPRDYTFWHHLANDVLFPFETPTLSGQLYAIKGGRIVVTPVGALGQLQKYICICR